jgi:methionyl-tRNA synthetase
MKGELNNVLYTVAEGLRFVALFLLPFIPESAEKILRQLGIDNSIKDINLSRETQWGRLSPGTTVAEPVSLFPRIEVKRVNDKGQEEPLTNDNLITIEHFAKVELKIGKVLDAQRVPKSDKLIKMQVDTGEIRQIVAGIGKSYAPEDLIGKKITVVCNLKPAKLMGLESRGMLLAATDKEGRLSILTPDREVSEGAIVR